MSKPDYFAVGILKLILANERMILLAVWLEDRVLSVSCAISLGCSPAYRGFQHVEYICINTPRVVSN